jgi:hypothetical protein
MVCFLIAIAWASCKKTTPPTVNWGKDAAIVRWDYRYYPTCGGFFMNLGNRIRFDGNSLYVSGWTQSVTSFFPGKGYYYKVPLFIRIAYKQGTSFGRSYLIADSITLR